MWRGGGVVRLRAEQGQAWQRNSRSLVVKLNKDVIPLIIVRS